MGMYDTFETDPTREQEGVFLDYGDFRIRVAHAGQGNKRYVAYAEKALRPVRQAMNAGALSNERSLSIMADVYAKTIVLDWQVAQKNEDGTISWKTGKISGSKCPSAISSMIDRAFSGVKALLFPEESTR